jgi:Asp-tRNA(Asn)/Glu-tRNA(Gln) amidotransferase A subunit family amidase
MQAGLASGEFSSEELLRAHLERIEAVNPKINAFMSVFPQHDAPRPGPLSGIPVTIKDSFDVEGQPTLCGSTFRRGHRAAHDATAVARLRAAGAVILGKTSTPEFLAMYETDNHLIGRTNNPWNLERTPGGSSGGESAAIAAGCSAGGIGSDGGGSVRLPAHFCGLAGLKPTPGRMPATGHYPLIQHPGGLLGVAGPLARTARDVKILFDVMQGYDAADPFSVPMPVPPPSSQSIRVGVMEQFLDVPVQSAVRRAVREAARLVSELGCTVDEFRPAGLERAPNVWSFFFSELAVPFTREQLAGREAEAHWTGTEFYDKLKDKPEPTGRAVVENLALRDSLRRRLLEQMADIPVLLSPTCGVTAFPHRQRRYRTEVKDIGLFQAMMPLTWVNLVGFPAITVPITMDEDGLPVGVQLIGRPWEEERILDLAIRLEQIRDPLPAYPSL